MKALTILTVPIVFFLVGNWYLSLPIMEVDLDGRCLRVYVPEGDRAVRKPCSWAKDKKYVTDVVRR